MSLLARAATILQGHQGTDLIREALLRGHNLRDKGALARTARAWVVGILQQEGFTPDQCLWVQERLRVTSARYRRVWVKRRTKGPARRPARCRIEPYLAQSVRLVPLPDGAQGPWASSAAGLMLDEGLLILPVFSTTLADDTGPRPFAIVWSPFVYDAEHACGVEADWKRLTTATARARGRLAPDASLGKGWVGGEVGRVVHTKTQGDDQRSLYLRPQAVAHTLSLRLTGCPTPLVAARTLHALRGVHVASLLAAVGMSTTGGNKGRIGLAVERLLGIVNNSNRRADLAGTCDLKVVKARRATPTKADPTPRLLPTDKIKLAALDPRELRTLAFHESHLARKHGSLVLGLWEAAPIPRFAGALHLSLFDDPALRAQARQEWGEAKARLAQRARNPLSGRHGRLLTTGTSGRGKTATPRRSFYWRRESLATTLLALAPAMLEPLTAVPSP